MWDTEGNKGELEIARLSNINPASLNLEREGKLFAQHLRWRLLSSIPNAKLESSTAAAFQTTVILTLSASEPENSNLNYFQEFRATRDKKVV